MENWTDFIITSPEPDLKIAERPGMQVLVSGESGEVFHRRAVRLSEGQQSQANALVARLNGVNVYIQNNTIVVTEKDIYL